jgi:hypothetical protein
MSESSGLPAFLFEGEIKITASPDSPLFFFAGVVEICEVSNMSCPCFFGFFGGDSALTSNLSEDSSASPRRSVCSAALSSLRMEYVNYLQNMTA